MTSAAYNKFVATYLEKKPDAKCVRARVLLHGGEWIVGELGLDEGQTLTIVPPKNAAHPGIIATEFGAVVALQMIM